MGFEDGWDPEAAMESLKMERSVQGTMESEEDLARRLFRENAAHAAQSIIHIAIQDPNSRTRLQAAQYVLERSLGRVGDDGPGTEDWVELLQQAMASASSD